MYVARIKVADGTKITLKFAKLSTKVCLEIHRVFTYVISMAVTANILVVDGHYWNEQFEDFA